MSIGNKGTGRNGIVWVRDGGTCKDIFFYASKGSSHPYTHLFCLQICYQLNILDLKIAFLLLTLNPVHSHLQNDTLWTLPTWDSFSKGICWTSTTPQNRQECSRVLLHSSRTLNSCVSEILWTRICNVKERSWLGIYLVQLKPIWNQLEPGLATTLRECQVRGVEKRKFHLLINVKGTVMVGTIWPTQNIQLCRKLKVEQDHLLKENTRRVWGKVEETSDLVSTSSYQGDSSLGIFMKRLNLSKKTFAFWCLSDHGYGCIF